MVKGVSLSFFLGGFLFFGLTTTIFSPTAFAGPGGMGGGPVCPPACPPTPVNCDANLVLTEIQALHFGGITAPLAGTVVVSTGGVRTSTGGVILVGAGGAAGTFSMSTAPYNCAGRNLVIVTAGPIATLTHASLPATMTVDNFTTNPVPGGVFDPTVPLTVGATLNVGASQAPGSYSGAYLVTVTFQ